MNSTDSQIILVVDATQRNLLLDLYQGRELLYSTSDDSGLPHSQRLFPLLETAIASVGITINQISAIGVNTGPGSFTGLRVGISAAKGLAAVLHCRLIGVNAIDAATLSIGATSVSVIVTLSASRGEAFVGVRGVSPQGDIIHRESDRVGALNGILPELITNWRSQRVVLLTDEPEEASRLLVGSLVDWEIQGISESLTKAIALQCLQPSTGSMNAAVQAYYIRPSDAELKH